MMERTYLEVAYVETGVRGDYPMLAHRTD